MSEPLGRITSLASIGEIFQTYPTINRLILKHVGESTWEIIKCDSERPNNLHQVAESTIGMSAYERNINQGFEALSDYHTASDHQYKVLYRLPSD